MYVSISCFPGLPISLSPGRRRLHMREPDATTVEHDHETPAQINWCLVGTLVILAAFWYFVGVPALAAFARLVW